MRRIAVVGAGLAGSIAALELAEAGVEVDLYDAGADALTGASYWCEGKVHLGFVYALGAADATVTTMLEGSRRFTSIVRRYVSTPVLDAAVSSPFLYAVPRDSMVGVDDLRAHFARVATLVEPHRDALPGTPSSPSWRELDRSTLECTFDGSEVIAAFETVEVAVDPWPVAHALRGTLREHPRIQTHLHTTVHSLGLSSDGATITTDQGQVAYDRVVNATWQHRLALDATAGVHHDRAVFHRYKLGLHGGQLPEHVPSVTFVLGSYGDVVRFPHRSYQSWYPAGMLATSTELAPPPASEVMAGVDPSAVSRQTTHALGGLMPSAASDLRRAADGATVAGGWITAWGRTDIDDRGSELHERYRVGAARFGPVVSVDTGKYSTAPYFGAQAARLAMAQR